MPAPRTRSRSLRAALALVAISFAAPRSAAQAAPDGAARLSLDERTRLEVVNGRAIWVEHRGRQALKLAPLAGQEQATDQEISALLVGSDFGDGTIEIDVAGARRQGYATDNVSAFKGFVGLSFRARGDSAERFYLRPENARLESQLFRNRSTQYEASPDFPWQVLRQASPGQYESYVDLEPGAWTRLRIEVDGTRARLFVNDAAQPALVVTELKHGRSRGEIALWTRISSDAYFSNLRVTPRTRSDAAPRNAAARGTAPRREPGEPPEIAEIVNGSSELVSYRGRRAVRLLPAASSEGKDEAVLALLAVPEFRNGSIEVDVAGTPRPGAPADSRGFVGISFRTGPHAEWSEVFYLRPLNGRAEEQVRRNRSVQYVSEPEYPWHRLRRENPGVYESYADLEAGAWTRMRIEVSGTTARLYVNDAPQPSLVVTDLKGGDRAGQIALWAHVETDAYFGGLRVRAR